MATSRIRFRFWVGAAFALALSGFAFAQASPVPYPGDCDRNGVVSIGEGRADPSQVGWVSSF